MLEAGREPEGSIITKSWDMTFIGFASSKWVFTIGIGPVLATLMVSLSVLVDRVGRERAVSDFVVEVGCLATGVDSPLSFPRLATPTPQVNWVLYPEQSFPVSRHCEQYGLRRSHFIFFFRQVKQSSAAPVAGALRRLLRGTAACAAIAVTGAHTGCDGDDMMRRCTN
jgi:hypothetical protein